MWTYVGAALVAVLSLALAWVAFATAPGHLSEVGFAARNREPNVLYHRLHNVLGFVLLGNAVLALTRWRVVAAVLLVPLTIANGWLFFATW